MSLVAPLSRVLGLGSAKKSVEHWWIQRLTAIALIPLGLWLIFAFAGLGDFGYVTVTTWVRSPINSVLLMLVVVTTSYHSQLGLRVIIEDYIDVEGLKFTSLILSIFLHIALTVVGVYSIAKVAFMAPV